MHLLLGHRKESECLVFFLAQSSHPAVEQGDFFTSSTRPQSCSIMSFYPASSEEEGQIYYQASSVSSSEKEGADYVSPLSLPSLEVRLKAMRDRPCSRSPPPPPTTTPVVDHVD